MSKRYKFTDSVNFEPVFDKKLTDFYQDPSQQLTSLRVRVAATHAGKITRNNGFYLPHKMREGAASFTSQYPKPIQVHHDDHSDPVGRVVAARYVDISQGLMDAWDSRKICDDKRPIEDSILKQFCDGKMSDAEIIDAADRYFIADESIVDDPDYQGLGYIELTADITDPDAIRKVLDKRYLTGSIGASTDSAVCSICKQNWASEDGLCEHRPGKMYDGKKCVLIAGNLEYEEWSFVNSPADTHSAVLAIDSTGDRDTVDMDDSIGKNEDVMLEILDHKQDSQQEDQSKEETNMLELKDKKQEDQPAPPTDEVKDDVQADKDQEDKTEDLQDDVTPPDGDKDDSPVKPEDDKVEDKADDADVQDDADPSEEEDEEVEDKKKCKRKKKMKNESGDDEEEDEDSDDEEADEDVEDSADEGDVQDDAGSEDADDKVASDVVAHALDSLGDIDDEMLLKVLEVTQKVVKERELDCPCSDSEAQLKERVDALQKEVKFLLEDADVLNSQLADLVQANRELKLQKIQDFGKLADADFDTEEKLTELKDADTSDLDQIIKDLAGQVDIAKIADKLNSGLSNNPQGTVENPVVIVDKQEKETTEETKLDRATLETIRANYFHLRFKNQVAADRYLADLRAKGILPKGEFKIEDKS